WACGKPATSGLVRTVSGIGKMNVRCRKNSAARPPRYPIDPIAKSHFRTVIALGPALAEAWQNDFTHDAYRRSLRRAYRDVPRDRRANMARLRHIPLTIFSVIFLASPSSIMVLSR